MPFKVCVCVSSGEPHNGQRLEGYCEKSYCTFLEKKTGQTQTTQHKTFAVDGLLVGS